MRRSRLAMLTIATLLLLAAVLLWHKREPLAVHLLNANLTTGQVTEFDGLQIGYEAIALENLILDFDSGYRLTLQNAVLSSPWGLIFGRQKNQAELAVEQLAYIPLGDLKVSSTPRASLPETTTTGNELRLSELLNLAVNKLPYRAKIKQLVWGRGPAQRGRLEFQRNETSNSAKMKLSSNSLSATAIVERASTEVKFDGRVLNQKSETTLSIHGTLTRSGTRSGDSTWQFESTATADLAKVSNVVKLTALPKSLQKLQEASGNINLTATGAFPDQVLAIEEYRDFTIKLDGDEIEVPLTGEQIGEELTLLLSTESPLEVRLSSISPLHLSGISGGADIGIRHSASPEQILTARLESQLSPALGTIKANGKVLTDGLAPLLQLPSVRTKAEAWGLTDFRGQVFFHANADLPASTTGSSTAKAQIENITITVLKDSQVTAKLASPAEPPAVLKSAGWQSGAFTISLPADVTLTSPRWRAPLQLDAKKLAIAATESKSDLKVDATLTQITCILDDMQQCAGNLKTTISALEFDTEEVKVPILEVSSELKFNRNAQTQNIDLQNFIIDASDIKHPKLQAGQVLLHHPKLSCAITTQELACESAAARAELTDLALEQGNLNGTIDLNKMELRQRDQALSFSTEIVSSELQVQTPDNVKADSQLTGSLVLTGSELTGDLKIDADMLTVSGNWQHNLDKSAGSAELSLQPATFSKGAPLSNAVSGLPLELVSGTVSGLATIHWPSLEKSKVALDVEDLAAVYEDIFATGITGRVVVINSDNLWQTTETSPLNIENLDVGMPVTDISFTPTLGPEQDLILNRLNAKLLEGSVSSPGIVWNLKGEERHSELTVEGISLRALEREMAAENFAATGALDLKIPLITSAEGITVKQGTVRARAPGGRLRYYGAFSAEMLAGNPQLKLLAGALEDYNYRELSGTVEYPPGGDMQMQLKLVGKSQSVDANRDLIINLNLENNVPAMLKSLQASRDLSEALEKQLQ